MDDDGTSRLIFLEGNLNILLSGFAALCGEEGHRHVGFERLLSKIPIRPSGERYLHLRTAQHGARMARKCALLLSHPSAH
jgi:hypothetical protein